MTTLPRATGGVARRPPSGHRRRSHGDHGASTAELAVVTPLLLVLVLASVHVGLWFHAHQIVTAAAQEAARAARAELATDADGYQKAEQMLTDLGPRSVTDPAVTVTRAGSTVTVTVTGQAPAVIPGLVLDVSATAASPIEEFTP